MKRFVTRFATLFAIWLAALIVVAIGCHRAPPKRLAAVANTLGTQPATVLGCTAVNPVGQLPYSTSLQCEQATDWVSAAISATTVIWSYDLAPGDDLHFSVDVAVKNVGGTTAGDHAQFTLAFGGSYNAGTFADPSASTSSRTVYSNVGANITGTTAVLAQSGSSLQLQVVCADSVGPYCVVHSSASISKGAQELAVVSVSPTTLSSVVANTTTITIGTTTGAGQFVTGATLGTVALSNCRSSTPFTTVSCYLLPGTYPVASSLAVGITTDFTIPIALPGGFAFTAPVDAGVDSGTDSGADASDASDSGTDASGDGGLPTLSLTGLMAQSANGGGPAVTLGGANLITGCSATSAGTAVTGVTCGGSTMTFTWPANTASGTLQSFVVTNSAGSTTYASAVAVVDAIYSEGFIANQQEGFGAPAGGDAGAWIDFIGGNVARPMGGQTMPTLSTSVGGYNSQPVAVFAGTNAVQTPAFGSALTQPGGVAVIGNTTSASATPQFFFDGIVVGSRWAYYSAGATNLSAVFNGGSAGVQSWHCSSPVLMTWINTNGAGNFTGPNGTNTFAGDNGSETFTGVTLGAEYNAADPFTGNIALALFAGSTMTSGAQTETHGVSQNGYGLP